MNTTKNTPNQHTEYSFPNPSIKQLCLNHGKIIKLEKGSTLFDEHSTERNRHIYYLAEGVCSVSGISSNGREQIFLYQTAGEMLGHVPYLMSKNAQSHPYAYRRPTILTKTNCVFYQIPYEFFVEYLNQYLEVSIYLNQQMAHNYSMALAHLKQIQEDSVVSSICRFLLQVATPSEGGLIVPKLFTYSEISRFLGFHEVTVSRVMGRMKQKSLITRLPSGLLIQDNAELENMIRHPETFNYK